MVLNIETLVTRETAMPVALIPTCRQKDHLIWYIYVHIYVW